MINFIKKTIHPPGINKPNRLALFSTIGEVTEKVRADALTAFNARFPYLADSVKLEEHGKALVIPHLADDTEKEYRDRVAAAGFFLTRAGERAYITEQLRAHFGDRYVLKDEFLNVLVRITGLEDTDRTWVTAFLDSMLNPNISLTVAEWFHFVEEIMWGEFQTGAVWRSDTDIYQRGLCCDGRFLCDQGKATLCDGSLTCDGSWDCEEFQPARGTIYDVIYSSIFPDGAYRCDGSFDCSGYIKIHDPRAFPGPIMPTDEFDDRLTFECGPLRLVDEMILDPLSDGSWERDGGGPAPLADAPMTIRVITPVRCDGSRTPSCSTPDGTWMCDGSHACFDGWYCSGDLIREEVV